MAFVSDNLQTFLEQVQIAFPELIIETVDSNFEGMVNDVIIVNGARIFRFPKTSWARGMQQLEVKTLAALRPFLTLPIPHYDYVSDEMVSYKMIPGVPLQRFTILRQDEATKDKLAQQLAEFMWQLHHVPGEITADSPTSDTARSQERWLELYERVQRDAIPLLMRFAREWVEQHFAPLLADPSFMDYEPMLMNGDLSPYHLLYDVEARCLSGVIDFGTVGMGDRAADFACIIDAYGESFLRRIGKYYPGIGDHIERARFWAGTLELQWLLGGLRSNDKSWFGVHIGRARDVSPIGSGW
jgi:aminoglycoside 2''-phosphotransferase